MQTIQSIIRREHISMTCEYASANPNMAGSENMKNYRCILKRKGKQMTVPFSTGLGWTREPSAEDVLDCLSSDAGGIENSAGIFEDWCAEYGYDSDSRKAEKIFKTCERQADKLKAFLGEDVYKSLLWDTERL
jgi:hypothetical protein